MDNIRGLAGQTAVYGISSILGRLLNYLLVPMYSRVFLPEESAVYVEMYAYVAFFIVILTYGMETAFFRNYSSNNRNKTVYSTVLWSIIFSSTAFVITALIFAQNIADFLRYPEHPEYIIYFILIVSLDAIASIPFAKLRADGQPFRFALIKVINILINISLNLILILLVPYLMQNSSNETLLRILSTISDGKPDIASIFISNLVASIVTIILLFPDILKAGFSFDSKLWRKMLYYAFPLLIFGLIGIVNETIDRILLKYLLPEETAMYNLGIYGMCFKISVFITIFIQAFRYAAEPFFFAQAQTKNAPETYAKVMNYFIIICLFIFLGIMLYIDIVKHFVGELYYEGLVIVPMLLLGHVFLGIFYNLSVWYKINDKTRFGAYFSIIGASISIGLNIYLIPKIGYLGSAWANFASYFIMMVLSYFYGQKHYPIPYKTGRFIFYTLFALGLYLVSTYFKQADSTFSFAMNSVLFISFIILVLFMEPELRSYLFLKRTNKEN